MLLFVHLAFSQAPTVDELRETSDKQSRDLSIPGSRIVINPFDFNQPAETTPSQYSNLPNLPLNIGYLSTEKVSYRRVNNLLSLYRYTPPILPDDAWVADLASLNSWNIQSQTSLEVTEEGLKFTLDANPNPAWKYLSNKNAAAINFDNHPILIISIPQFSGGQWSLKMKDENGIEKVLRQDAAGSGIFEYDMAGVSGWSGTKNVTFYLFCIGGNTSITIDSWKVVELGNSMPENCEYHTAWMPNELTFDAAYSDGASCVGTDFFYDANTLVRRMKLTEKTNAQAFFLVGAYSGQTVTFENNVLIQNKGAYSIALSVNVFEHFPVRFYQSLAETGVQSGGSGHPSKIGYWSVQIDVSQIDDVIASVAFSYVNDAENPAVLSNRVKVPLTVTNADAGYNARKQYWNDYLAKVPRPAVFGIEETENKNVTAAEIALCYYKAWTFIASNLLMADPVKFPYPQVVAGKASLWDEGHDSAPYSATWESFFGIQFLAFTDTENAWQAFEGIMSLVDHEGSIGGESLPSRKAQTAWLLYEMTGDKNRLAGIYDPLERYLNWRVKYPHWIFHSQPDIHQKDAEFVFSAVIDLDFMAKISRVVKNETVAAEWEGKAQNFYNECLPWFWTSPQTPPVQYYNTETHARSAGNRYWVTSGLFMNELSDAYLQSMMILFNMGFNDKKNFGGQSMGHPKYPDISYTVYGLMDKIYMAKAEKVIDACIRDIIRSGNWFSESYNTVDAPYPSGVRPSLFGASMMIDFIMMKNGFRYGNGTPMVVNAFGGARSINNIHFGDGIINISRNTSGDIDIDGSYVENAYTQSSQRGDSYIIRREGGSSIGKLVREKPFTVTKNEGDIYIQFNSATTNNAPLKILDICGRTIQTVDLPACYSGNYFRMEKPSAGVYILMQETKNGKYAEKTIVN
jgi:hypothetical protein